MLAWGFANFVGVTFFFLFLNFYLENYVKSGDRKGPRTSRGSDLANGKKDVKQE